MTTDQRIELDALGDIKVPSDALYGAQTARAAAWSFSGQRFPLPVIHAIAHFKAASASVRGARGELSPDKARAIEQAALEVADGQHDDHFPLEVFQTGSATSANMNVNEVVANRAALLLGASLPSRLVHPNDDVNAGQSSNDVVPSALHLALLQAAGSRLRPALDRVITRFHELADSHWQDIRDGKTHLMRATPL
ncbi:MAG: fumarate hydratase class II, partial [Candidatus Azotimanducaceae bacterium]